MSANKSGKLDQKTLLDIATEIHRIVEERGGPQEHAGLEIEYAFHAALIMVEAATRHQPGTQRAESLRIAVTMFSEIAEASFIQCIGPPPVAQ